MAKLKPCKTCGREIAKTAKVCPGCGAKNRQTPWPGLVLLAVVAVVFIVAVSGGDDPPPPIFAEGVKVAVRLLHSHKAVVDAGVGQDGRTLFLTVVVTDSTSGAIGRGLGERFTRLVRTFAAKDSETLETLPRGTYDYHVDVLEQSGKRIATGKMNGGADNITW